MGRKTISLSSTNVSANKSATSHTSSYVSKSTGITRSNRKSLTPDIPASLGETSSPSPSSCPSTSAASVGECSNTSQTKSHFTNPPVKRPRSVGAAAKSSSKEGSGVLSKKNRALVSASALQPSNEASSSRKRPSSSNSDAPKLSEETLESISKQLKTEAFDSDCAELPDNDETSTSKSYWLRSSSVMKRVSNSESNSSGRSLKQTSGQSVPLQASNDSISNQPQQQKPRTGSGILASLVGSSSSKSNNAASTNRPSGKQQGQSSGTSTSKASLPSKLPSSKAANSTSSNAASSQGTAASRRSHGAKLLSSTNASSSSGQSSKMSSPRESGRHASGSGKVSSGSNSSGVPPGSNLSEVAASFANAAAAMNSLSSSGSTTGIPTLPSGSSDHAAGSSASGSGSGAANLLRQFGKFLSRGGSQAGPTSARAMALINQLQSAAFDTEQLQCLQDLCDIINMNTEDALQEFPARQASMVLTDLMSGASGFEVAISACRALTYMLDCVPHASKFVTVDTVRCLISKLNDIECIDIAEQALSALEFLSASHHSKAVLRAGGVAACLQFIDFFSTLCQQKSLTIVANCCVGLTPADFAQIRHSVDRLSQQLLNQDRKCVELVSLTFSHIVSGCERDETVIREVASHGFLLNAQQVLVQIPPVVGPAVYCQIFNTLSVICRQCPDQAVQLLLQNFPSTLAFLLTGNREALAYTNEQPTVLLSSGNTPGGICSGSQELAEIVALISELLPPQPDEELFSTFPVLPAQTTQSSNPLSAASQYMAAFLQSPFEWTDNPFSFLASSHVGDDDEDPTAQALLAMQSAVMGGLNSADPATAAAAASLHQRRQGGGTGPSHQQTSGSSTSSAPVAKSSVLVDLFAERPQLFHGLVANLTGPLLDICQTTTAGTIELKAKCLETLQRLLLVAPDAVLDAMIRAADLSSCLAQFLSASNASDLRVAGLALQICHLLLRRCPELFASQAVKQGISHQIAQTLAYVALSGNSTANSSDEQHSGGSGSRPGSGEVVDPSLGNSIEADARNSTELQQTQDNSGSKRTNSRLSGGAKQPPVRSQPSVKGSNDGANTSRVVRSSSRGSGQGTADLSTSSSIGTDEANDSSVAASGFRKLRSTVKSVLSRGKAAVGGTAPAPAATAASATRSQNSVASGSSLSSSQQSGRNATKSDGSPNPSSSSRSRVHGNRQQLRGQQQSSNSGLSLENASTIATNTFHAQLRAWITQWAKMFLEKLQEVVRHCDQSEQNENKTPGLSTSNAAFCALKAAATNLVANNSIESLIEIRDLIMTQDFSLFELGSSGLTDSLVSFLNSASTENLRLFLRMFAVLPPGLEFKMENERSPESFQRQPLTELVSKLVGCLQQIEQFEVKSAVVRDRNPASSLFSSGGLMPSSLLAAAMTSSGGANSGAAAFSVSPVVRFFSTCSLKLELRRAQQNQPKQQSSSSSASRLSTSANVMPSCLVRIDPLLTVDVLSRWIVQKGLHSNNGPLSSLGSHRTSRTAQPHNQQQQQSQQSSHRGVLDASGDTSSVSGAEDFDDGDSSIADFSSTMTDDGGMSSGPESSAAAVANQAPLGDAAGSAAGGGGAGGSLRTGDSGRGSSSGVQVELLLDDVVLPPEMTLYQAVAQFGLGLSDESLFSLSSSDALFQSPHAIHFRIRTTSLSAEQSTSSGGASSEEPTESSSVKRRSKGSTASFSSSRETKSTSDPVLCESSHPERSLGVLDEFLRKVTAPPNGIVSDSPVANILALLRMLYGLNRYWYTLFDVMTMPDSSSWWFPNVPVKALLPADELISPKLNLKAHRQLRDTFVLATGIVPKWLQQVCSNWPFLLSYDVRQQIFYLTTFGRDRGILRLNHSNSHHAAGAQNANSQQASTLSNQSGSVASTGPSASFGGGASLSASDQAVNGWLARIVRSVEKRRYEVSRSQLLADAMRVLKQSSAPAFRSSIVEIQYKNEVGVGLGPTLEFYALVSRQLQSPELDLWHAAGSNINHPGAFLYPKSHNASSIVGSTSSVAEQHGGNVEIFRFLGQFVARAIVDGRMVDLNFNPLFIDRLLMAQSHHNRPLPTDLLWVDKVLARSVAQLVQISRHDSSEVINNHLDDLMLDFTVPGRPDADISGDNPSYQGPLNAENLQAYISALLEFFLTTGVSDFLSAFSDGFNSVFPIDSMRRYFCSPSEIEAFLGGCNDLAPWDPQLLREAIRPDHGYNQDSPVLQWLIDVLVQLDYVQRRLFLQFATGTPRLPLGGFSSLSPPLTVVRRALEQSANPDDFLPSVMTCANYLKMPEYSTPEILRRKLLLAITDGQETFHLS